MHRQIDSISIRPEPLAQGLACSDALVVLRHLLKGEGRSRRWRAVKQMKIASEALEVTNGTNTKIRWNVDRKDLANERVGPRGVHAVHLEG